MNSIFIITDVRKIVCSVKALKKTFYKKVSPRETDLSVRAGGMEVDIIIITTAIALGHVLYQFLLLLCLPIFFWSHLPPLPSGDLPDVLEEEIVIYRLVIPLWLGVVALAAVDAGVLGHVHLGGVASAGLLGHQLHDHLVAEMLQRGTEVEVSNSGLCCDLTVLNCYSELLPFHFKRFD